MKICFISPYPPKKGGLSVYSKRTVDSLSIKKNLDLTVIPFNSFWDVFDIFKINKLNPDVVRLEYNIPAYGLASIFIFLFFGYLRKFKRLKLVVNYHEVKRETDFLGSFGIVFYKIFSSVFNQIYVHTNEAKKILIERCNLKPSKVHVIPLGVYIYADTENHSSKLLQEYNLSEKPIILYLGYIHVDKGIEYLLKAIHLLKISDPGIVDKFQVIIAGDVRKRSGLFKYFEKKDTEYKDLLKKYSSDNRLDDHVKFIGYIGDKYVYTLIKTAFLVVLPYTKAEQSGVLNMVIPLGRPIIASKIGGLNETLRNVGILVQPKDELMIAKEIKKLVEDRVYYQQVINGYKKIVPELHPLKTTQKFINTLKYE